LTLDKPSFRQAATKCRYLPDCIVGRTCVHDVQSGFSR
jgi:hypothetical protein